MDIPPCGPECHKKWGAVAYVEYVENRLGWAPVDTEEMPRWKSLMVWAGKVNKKVAQSPQLYSWDNLVLTVDWLAKKKVSVRTPAGVFFFVDEAIKRAAAAEAIDDVSGEIFTALTEAMVAGEADWVDKLARARGKARPAVLQQWRDTRG